MLSQRNIAMVLIIFLALIGLFQSGIGINNAYGSTGEGDLNLRLQDALVLYLGSPTALIRNTEKLIDDGNAEVTPVYRGGRTLVPVRFIAEHLGSQVSWDPGTSTVTITIQGKEIKLVLGSAKMLVNEDEFILDVPPESSNGRTYVPLRAVTEAFGRKVFYDRGLIIISDREGIFNPQTEVSVLDKVIARVNNLPNVGSESNLKNLLSQAGVNQHLRSGPDIAVQESTMKAAAPSPAPAAPGAADSGGGYSTTNIQVPGVDEADMVKTDGRYIYHLSKGRIVISRAYPAEEMKVESIINLAETGFLPQEMYLDEKYLVVIGQSGGYQIMAMEKSISPRIYPPPYIANRVKAVVYDIADKAGVKKIREVEVDGNYVSSRRIDSALYLVANHYPSYYRIQEEGGSLAPTFRDSVLKDADIEVPYSEIRYIPPVIYPNYLLIAGFDLSQPQQAVQVSTYLGSGENIYVSAKNMYIAVTQHQNYHISTGPLEKIAPVDQTKTMLYKFSLNKGQATYLGKGEAPGTILNQFSMDEHNGYFRIATTSGQFWSTRGSTSQNNVYILDDSLNLVGRIENIAPGERIYSTRFMGNRAYMVTFKNVDPLFVLDLQEPSNPKILGALKIPGYSDYLHPYDENHIIGFGKDTIELTYKDYRGNIAGTQAYYLGMKMALFDVSDVSNPREKFKETIGDRGTHSELLHNHKALLFDKTRNLLAFPITVMKVEGNPVDDRSGVPQYGKLSFQGAYVYNLDLLHGFVLQGTISHLSGEDHLKAGYSGYNPNKEVKRVMYINNILYTLSEDLIKANKLPNLEDLKSLSQE